MDNQIGKIQKQEPQLSDVLYRLKKNVFSNLNCHNIGKIIDFDANTQTCTVEIMQIKQFGEKYYTPAPITQVPLILYGGGNGFITLPNPVGSYCLLFFMDRNIDNFLLTGEQYVPETGRMHDFTDCIAITTFSTMANPITNYDEDAISILNKSIIEEIKYNTEFRLYGNEIKIKSTSINTEDETFTSNMNIDSNQISISSGLGSQIIASDKLSISNTNQNLNSLIQAFITACENITTVNGGALTPASKQPFTDLKTQFEELLQ